jgi:hypothetical protein
MPRTAATDICSNCENCMPPVEANQRAARSRTFARAGKSTGNLDALVRGHDDAVLRLHVEVDLEAGLDRSLHDRRRLAEALLHVARADHSCACPQPCAQQARDKCGSICNIRRSDGGGGRSVRIGWLGYAGKKLLALIASSMVSSGV